VPRIHQLVPENQQSAAGIHGGQTGWMLTTMNGWFWGLGILYLVLVATLAVMTFRKGHWVLGLIGFIFPILWLIGAVLPSRYARGRH
jgi:hypothetical protein